MLRPFSESSGGVDVWPVLAAAGLKFGRTFSALSQSGCRNGRIAKLRMWLTHAADDGLIIHNSFEAVALARLV